MLKILPPVIGPVRMTAKALQALKREGNKVRRGGAIDVKVTPKKLDPDLPPSMQERIVSKRLYKVVLVKPPKEIVLCFINHAHRQHRAIRTHDDPSFQKEWPEALPWWEIGEFVPCPRKRCGATLVWYEAGYVPGYRICLHGHHAQLSEDGRTATAVKR